MILASFLLRCSGHELWVRVKRVLTGKSEIVSNKGALLPAQSLFLHSALLYTTCKAPSAHFSTSHSTIFTRTLCSLQARFVTSIFEGLATQIETLPQ